MKAKTLWISGFLSCCGLYGQHINEIDVDQNSIDSQEFIELYWTAHTDLSGMVVVLFNGNNNMSYKAIDLDGHTTDADGFFVIGSAAVPNVDLVAFTTNGIQNGTDAIALYAGNWTSGAPTTTNLIDALVYDTDDAVDSELLTALGVSKQFNENANGNATQESLQLQEDLTYSLGSPTPGNTNVLNLAKEGYIRGFTYYPNPILAGKFKIETQNKAIKKIEIFDSTGALVLRDIMEGDGEVNVETQKAGVYIFSVKEEGKQSMGKLIVK